MPVDIAALREAFKRQRLLRLDAATGKSLWIVDVTQACGEPAVLVAYEGGGVMRFVFDRPLNAFRLVTAGFPGAVSKEVVDLLTALFPSR